ncbi:hypothetical protein [Sphingomonas faeni]|uniref:hypothetical protein n=1 Tax=Sphingomonas faeni TaxID=185950 RepID=UPI0020BF6171|nr:hypothetical protein [Sphingomonas faeni]MCK8456310.1 hypothetical protein [Sphingomonas faeni]
MDFMKWLSSLDELLYEVMSWLIFFPLTLWRAVFQPIAVMEQVEREAALPDDQQYAALVRPPLFLALALLLAHTVSAALGQTDKIIANTHGLAGLVNDNTTALAFRAVIFAAFPLFLAARIVRCRGAKLDRGSLRQPFYVQCYPAAVFALGISLSAVLIDDNNDLMPTIGHWLMGLSTLNYWLVVTGRFAKVLGTGYLRATGNVAIGMFEGALFLVGVGFLFTR